MGTIVYIRVYRERHLLLVSDGQTKNTGPVFQSSYAAQSGFERSDGRDVDWQFLSLWRGSGETWTFRSRSGLAAFHFSFHRGGQHLGTMERRVERIAPRSSAIIKPGTRYFNGCHRHLDRQQLGLAATPLEQHVRRPEFRLRIAGER